MCPSPRITPRWSVGVLVLIVYMKEGEACEIDNSTRPALELAAKLLGVEGGMLEKAMVSKIMAVRGLAQACLTMMYVLRFCAAAAVVLG